MGANFQTQSIECCASPALFELGQVSVAASSTFALPDVSDRIFTCGLAVFRSSWGHFLEASNDQDNNVLGFHASDLSGVLCAVTLTSKGDIYAHNLLESHASYKRSMTFDGLPVGGSLIPVPKSTVIDKSAYSWNCLRISLQNDYAVPSHAILPLSNVPQRAEGIINLLPILDSKKNSLREKIVKENKRRKILQRTEKMETEGNMADDGDVDCGQESGGEGPKAPVFAQICRQGLSAVAISTGHGDCGSLRIPSHLLPQPHNRELVHFLSENPFPVKASSAARRSDFDPDIINSLWEECSDSEKSDALT